MAQETMKWSPQQAAALDDVSRWLKSPGGQQVYRLFGYAGSGKSTLAKHLAETSGGLTCFAAFTGKAASVMRHKGCPDATTIHSLIYFVKQKSQARLVQMQEALRKLLEDPDSSQFDVEKLEHSIRAEQDAVKKPAFTLNPDAEIKHADLVVIDECSMVGEDMAMDLLSFGVPILVLGDPAQLPPVRSAGFFTEHKPDFMLTEIHRQAAESPILRLATRARKGLRLDVGKYGDSEVLRARDFDNTSLTTEQVIVGRNTTRRRANAKRRECLGFSGRYPQDGDRVICLRNNHDIGVLNGEIYTVETAHAEDSFGDRMGLSLVSEDGDRQLYVDAHLAPFRGEDAPYWDKEAIEMDFGYAVTAHKAQGSGWPSVVVVDESSVFRKDRHRWLYTAATRAIDKLTVVLP